MKLENVRPSLDWDVEKDGTREIKPSNDSYDYLFDIDELPFGQGLIDDDDKGLIEDSRDSEREIAEQIAQSRWTASDLGKCTINTPTKDKQEGSKQDGKMEIFDEKEFQRAVDDFDKTVGAGGKIKAETNADIERIMQEMSRDW